MNKVRKTAAETTLIGALAGCGPLSAPALPANARRRRQTSSNSTGPGRPWNLTHHSPGRPPKRAIPGTEPRRVSTDPS